MGIRFLCSNCGHKLNVKSFLAGKRGVCPQCNSGLDIPLESQISKTAPRGEAVGVAVEAAAPAITVPAPDLASVPEAIGPQIPLPNVAPREMAKKPPSRSALAEGPALPAVSATSDSGPLAVPMQPIQQMQPLQVEADVALPVQPALPDPIDEAPEAIWYVRPPTGGQYGPARGEIMRKWIGEGRVSADSLVWREGWNDWCTASDVFASLGAGVTPPVPAPVAPNSSFPGSSTPASSSLRPRRRNSTALAVTVVAVLGVMCVTLFVALILILVN